MNPLLLPIDDFTGYWKGLNPEQLSPLFLLADELEEKYDWVDNCIGRILTKKSAEAFYQFDDLEGRIIAVFSATGLCLDFDWKSWNGRLQVLQAWTHEELKALEPLELCMILSACTQHEKAAGKGALLSKLENKFLLGVIRSLQHQIEMREIFINRMSEKPENEV